MRTKDQELLTVIQEFIEEYCEQNGYGPSVRAVAAEMDISVSSAQSYMSILAQTGRIKKLRKTYQSLELAYAEQNMRSVAIVGAIPCGALTACEEYIEGYIRLPESMIGQGKFYLLKAFGNSMVDANIEDDDLVLIKQQETAEVGAIVVALVNGENTLKRVGFDENRRQYYLHPENETMEDIYMDELSVQGVAVKVIKDIV